MYTGPKLTNDDLVFGHDTGYGVADNSTSTRFYPGEPTTNLYTNSDFSNGETGWTFSSWDGNISHTATTVEGPYGETVSANKLTVNAASAYSHFHQYNQNKYSSGSTYTTSAWVKGNGVFQIKSHWGGNVSLTLTGEWQRITQTVTATSSSTSNFPYLAGEGLTVGTDCYVTMCQTELKGHATPYVYSGSTNGSRSNTESLIDLTKSTDLTLSAMTYDSTGQPDFDGTNDYINLGDYAPIRLGTNFTIECVVRPEEDKWMYFFHKGYGSNNSLAWGRHSSSDNWFFSTMIGGSYQNSYMGTATLNKYCHLVATYDGANLRLYENGDLKVTSAKTHDMLTSSASAGIGGPDRYWNGKIPVTKIYSKVLTTEEVVSNFNAYKNRFNI